MAPMARGMAWSRKGSPVMGLQTIIDRLTQKKPKRHRKVAAVGLEEAQQAHDVLQKSKGRGARFRDATLVGGALSPLVRGIGRAAESAVMAPKGQRLRAAVHGISRAGKDIKDIKGFMGTNRGEVAKHVIEGGLGGAVVNQGREGLEIGRAKRKATEFLRGGPSEKLAAGLRKSVPHLADKIRTVPLRPLTPIMDDEVEFEV
jgi:hypothetical protein